MRRLPTQISAVTIGVSSSAFLGKNGDISSRGFCLQSSRCALNKFDAVEHAGRARNVANAFETLELNLFDDPNGGLTAGPAEELSTTEIEHQVRLNVSSYSRSIFYLLYTPFVDVISVLLERGLAPECNRPGEIMCRWFTDGALTLQNPLCMEEAMGINAWQQLCEGLDAFYEHIEPVMPLTAAVRKHNLPEELIVPFLRQLAMDLLVPLRKRNVFEILPGLILGMANGRAPTALQFPIDNQKARAIIAADLFLAVGQETGNTDLAYLGIQLLRANDIPVPFPKQKQLTNVFSAAARIQTDWQMRVSGQLIEVLPKWMDYYKKVHMDNLRAMKGLNGVHPTTSTAAEAYVDNYNNNDEENEVSVKKETNNNSSSDDDSVHDYFSSHRVENLERLSALESRVLDSVRRREIEWQDDSNKLFYRFRRKRSAAVEEWEDTDMKNMSINVDEAEKGSRRAKTKQKMQTEKEEPKMESKPKQRRSKAKKTLIPSEDDDDDGSTVVVSL